jgi:hypothetical protein
MKSIRLIVSLLIIVCLAGIMSCHKKTPEKQLTDQQKQAKLLAGTWTTNSVDQSPSGIDPSVISTLAFTFNVDTDFNPTTFASTGAPDFFGTQSSSTWGFSGSSTTVVTLSGLTTNITQLQINSVSETSLSVTFTFVTARTEKLDGDYTLTMSK